MKCVIDKLFFPFLSSFIPIYFFSFILLSSFLSSFFLLWFPSFLPYSASFLPCFPRLLYISLTISYPLSPSPSLSISLSTFSFSISLSFSLSLFFSCTTSSPCLFKIIFLLFSLARYIVTKTEEEKKREINRNRKRKE